MSDYVRYAATGEYPKQGRSSPALSRLDIELTERCDNNCAHCYIRVPQDDVDARRREMSTEQVKAVLSEAADLGAMNVRFTGGEPLIREDFAELYLFARRLGLSVTLFTNARGISAEIADLLAHVPPRELVEVSVYGMSQKTYDATARCPGAYEQFRRGVELLLERGVPFVVKGPLLPGLAEEVVEFEEWAATLPSMSRPPGYSMLFDLRVRRDALDPVSERCNELVGRLRPSPAEAVSFLSRDREDYLKRMRAFCTSYVNSSGGRLFPCGAGRIPCVDAYGRVQACLLLRDPETTSEFVGQPGGLRHALEEVFLPLRERRATNPEYLRRCARCCLKSLCEQCPAKSWAETGTLDTPVEYFCAVAHEQARDLGLLAPGEQAWTVTDWEDRVKGL